MNKMWWKFLCVALMVYVFIAGFIMPVPDIAAVSNLKETIRNLYFHVPMWFTQLFLYGVGTFYGIKYLMQKPADKNYNPIKNDIYANSAITAGTVFGCMGLATGMIWGKYTWGSYWSDDPKLNTVAIGMLLYFAYFILRGSVDDIDKKAKLAAVYNIFCFPLYIVLIMVIPRLTDSVHPGNGGNPAFSKYDLDSNMRMVFYPAVIGWILLGSWITSLLIRIESVKVKLAFSK